MYVIAERSVVKANPPLAMTMSLPSRRSQGKGWPSGPRTPILRPGAEACSSLVSTPMRLTENRRAPSSVGEEAMPIGDSPLPKRESSANCPGR